MDQQNKRSSDEIDLVDILKKLVFFVRNGLRRYTGILLRNAILFLSIFAITAVIGFSLRYFLPQYFKTQAVYVSHYMPANMYALLLDDLSRIAASNKNASIIAGELKIPEKSAAAIHAIETQPLNNQDFQYKNDTTTVNAFRVTLVLKDVTALKEIQTGIRNYLENNEYSLKRKNAKRKTLELLKADLVQKRNSLDSLQQIYNRPNMPQVSGQVVVLAQSLMPVEAYKMLQSYNDRQLEIEQELDMVENIEIVEPFLKMNAPNSLDFKKIFLISLLLALLLSLTLTPLIGKR